LIVKIAVSHNVSTIKFEDLSWSVHSKRAQVGSYLAYWQIHWFFSKIQECASGLINKHHNMNFKLINPYYTSQNCFFCGKTGIRNKKVSALFKCNNRACKMYGKEINDNLMAARNIAVIAPIN
ncbi:MAG: zinc ribbon domain-containing protein, partial [Promethearchaeota archaeon]